MSVKTRIKLDTGKVRRAVQKSNYTSLNHAAAALRLIVRRSIRRSKKPGPAGQPPRTRRGQIKRAIKFDVDPKRAIALIGPDAEVVGDSAKAHEFGGRYRGEQYEQRPFMRPGFDIIRPRLPAMWANSVGA